MALALLTTTAFEKDLRRVRKQGKNVDKLEDIVNLLQKTAAFASSLPATYVARQLAGTLGLHIAPDWLLLYRVTNAELILVRTGSRAELFE